MKHTTKISKTQLIKQKHGTNRQGKTYAAIAREFGVSAPTVGAAFGPARSGRRSDYPTKEINLGLAGTFADLY